MRSGPTALRVIQNTSVTEGSSVTLWCEFLTVDEDTTYSWFKGPNATLKAKINSSFYDSELVGTENTGLERIEHKLTIRNVSRRDQGWYACQARNNIKPSYVLKTYLRVGGRPCFIL